MLTTAKRGCQGSRPQRIIRAVEPEIRIVVGIAAPQIPLPLGDEQSILAAKPGELLRRILVAARLRLEVIELRLRRPEYTIARGLDLQTQVDVVEREHERFV